MRFHTGRRIELYIIPAWQGCMPRWAILASVNHMLILSLLFEISTLYVGTTTNVFPVHNHVWYEMLHVHFTSHEFTYIMPV